jgi:hypothetical protein
LPFRTRLGELIVNPSHDFGIQARAPGLCLATELKLREVDVPRGATAIDDGTGCEDPLDPVFVQELPECHVVKMTVIPRSPLANDKLDEIAAEEIPRAGREIDRVVTTALAGVESGRLGVDASETLQVREIDIRGAIRAKHEVELAA